MPLDVAWMLKWQSVVHPCILYASVAILQNRRGFTMIRQLRKLYLNDNDNIVTNSYLQNTKMQSIMLCFIY